MSLGGVGHVELSEGLFGLRCLVRLGWPERVSKPSKDFLVPREIHLSN